MNFCTAIVIIDKTCVVVVYWYSGTGKIMDGTVILRVGIDVLINDTGVLLIFTALLIDKTGVVVDWNSVLKELVY